MRAHKCSNARNVRRPHDRCEDEWLEIKFSLLYIEKKVSSIYSRLSLRTLTYMQSCDKRQMAPVFSFKRTELNRIAPIRPLCPMDDGSGSSF